MRVSINKLTGKLIESQSGGETHANPKIDNKGYAEMNLETLRQNAIYAGHLEKDIEVKFVTDTEFKVIIDSQPQPEKTPEQIYEEQIAQKEKEILRRQAIAELKEE